MVVESRSLHPHPSPSLMTLVEIAPGRSGVRIDLAYARADNVTGKPIYAQARCYLHPSAAASLDRAAELARPHGLRLKIFDAYRPTEAQWVLWNAFPDPEFVADPRRGCLIRAEWQSISP